MKKILFTLLLIASTGLFAQSGKENTMKPLDTLTGPQDFKKGSRYIIFWGHAGINYGYDFDTGKRFAHGFQIQPWVGYGYFFTDKLTGSFNIGTLYYYQMEDDRELLSNFLAFSPGVRYYFTKKGKLFIGTNYYWVRQWNDYNFKRDYTVNFRAMSIFGGVNLRLLRRKDLGWFTRRLNFEVSYHYFIPLSTFKSIYFTDSMIKFGFVLFLDKKK